MATSLSHAARYLQRLGFAHAPPPTLATLRTLQLRHTQAFPFETLATLLHMPVPLALPALERKLLLEGRGGYCYELNTLFLALLRQLGFDARGISGRVLLGGPEDAHTARTHMALLVERDGASWLVDVGFGGMVPTTPLRLDSDAPQATPHEPFRITPHGDGWMLHAQVAGTWRALYRFDLQPQAEIDDEVGNWYVSTHPQSPFRDQLRVARTGPGVRHTLHNGRYSVHRIGAPSRHRALDDVDAVIGLLQQTFAIVLPPHPDLRAAIARCLETGAAVA